MRSFLTQIDAFCAHSAGLEPSKFKQKHTKVALPPDRTHNPRGTLWLLYLRTGDPPCPNFFHRESHPDIEGSPYFNFQRFWPCGKNFIEPSKIVEFHYFWLFFDDFKQFTFLEAFQIVPNCLRLTLGSARGLRNRSTIIGPFGKKPREFSPTQGGDCLARRKLRGKFWRFTHYVSANFTYWIEKYE